MLILDIWLKEKYGDWAVQDTERGNILTYMTMVIVNGLAGSTTLLGGRFTSEISDANPTLIAPAGYVFGIWGSSTSYWGVRHLPGPAPRSNR